MLLLYRNVSSAGIEADQKEAFVDALLYLLRGSYVLKNADEKSVEHVIYILQNSSRADLHPFGKLPSTSFMTFFTISPSLNGKNFR